MRRWIAAAALVALACGGGADSDEPAESAAPAADAVADAPVAQSGTVHEVRMLLTADGQYVYQPATLSIRTGDRVRWVNVSGGPHNVAFYRDRVPGGAADFLTAMMTDQISPLSGKLMIQANEAYEISFAGAPAGTYAYFCTPHEMLGMVAELTVLAQ